MRFKFILDKSIRALPPSFNVDSTSTSASTHEYLHGDYTIDVASGKFNKSWNSLDEMKSWLRHEEENMVFELRLKEKRMNNGMAEDKGWTECYYYVCARKGTGGEKQYDKKHPEWDRKVPTKRCRCTCHLTVKCYPNTPIVLGVYKSAHSHPIGNQNARFMRLSIETRSHIAEMLRLGVSADRIVSTYILIL